MDSPSGDGAREPERASPLKREMLRGALSGKIAPKDFPAWYQDILGKPFVALAAEDVKPLLDAAWWIGKPTGHKL